MRKGRYERKMMRCSVRIAADRARQLPIRFGYAEHMLTLLQEIIEKTLKMDIAGIEPKQRAAVSAPSLSSCRKSIGSRKALACTVMSALQGADRKGGVSSQLPSVRFGSENGTELLDRGWRSV